MKIGIDGSSITPDKVGVGYYAFSIIKALSEIDNKNEYYIFTNNIQNLAELDLKSNFRIIEINSKQVNFSWIWRVSNYLNKNNIDVFFSTSNFSFGILFNKTTQVVHDLAPIKFPQFFSKKGSLMYRFQLNLCMRSCKNIFTTSHTISQEIINYMPSIRDKVVNGGFGVHEWAFTPTSPEDLKSIQAKYKLPYKYFLSVSTLEPRKNHIKSILAFNEFYKTHKDFHYVIVGKKGWFFEEIFEITKSCEAKNNIHFLGYVPEADLPSLYDLSKGVIMLSFYEGIGLSALEAYVRGVPVLVSDIAIFHEVLADDGIFIDPNNIELIALGMDDLSEKNKSSVKPKEKYSWDHSAQKLLETL